MSSIIINPMEENTTDCENQRSAVGILCYVSIIIYLSLGRWSYIVETNTLEPLKRCLAKSSFRSAKQRFWRRKRMEICWGTHTRSHQDHILSGSFLWIPLNNTTERGFWNASKSPKGLKKSEVAQHNQQEIKNMLSFVMKMLWLPNDSSSCVDFFSWFQCRNRRESFNLSTSSPGDLKDVKEIAKEERENWSLVCFGTLIFDVFVSPCFGSMVLYFMLFYLTNYIKIKDLNCLDLLYLDCFFCHGVPDVACDHVFLRS